MTPGVIFTHIHHRAIEVNENGLRDQSESKMTPGVIFTHIYHCAMEVSENSLRDHSLPTKVNENDSRSHFRFILLICDNCD